MEHAQNINTMSSDYYTALSLEEQNSPVMLYDDINRQAEDNETSSSISGPNIDVVGIFDAKSLLKN